MAGSQRGYELIPELATRLEPMRSIDREGGRPTAHRPSKTGLVIIKVLAACVVGLAGIGSFAYLTWSNSSKNGPNAPKGGAVARGESPDAKSLEPPPVVAKSDGRRNEPATVAPTTDRTPVRSQDTHFADAKPTAPSQKESRGEGVDQSKPRKNSKETPAPPQQQRSEVAKSKDDKLRGGDQAIAVAGSSPSPKTAKTSEILKPLFIDLEEPKSDGTGDVPMPTSQLKELIGVKCLALRGAASDADLQSKCEDDSLSITVPGPFQTRATLAHFRIMRDGSVSFEWDRRMRSNQQIANRRLLRGCYLEVDTSDAGTAYALLTKAPRTNPEALKPMPRGAKGRLANERSRLVDWCLEDSFAKNTKHNIRIGRCSITFPHATKSIELVKLDGEKQSWLYEESGKRAVRVHFDNSSGKIRFEFEFTMSKLNQDVEKAESELKSIHASPPQPGTTEYKEFREKAERLDHLKAFKKLAQKVLDSSYSMILIEEIGAKEFEIARFGEFADGPRLQNQGGRE
jgi:hypothetical protein